MNKLVYLYELDSVNMSKKEIEYGQSCMYKEILYNGNQVVITFNQLTDSNVFLKIISNPNYYEDIIRLFEIGAIKVSLYSSENGNINYSASQYIQSVIDRCLDNSNGKYIFSSLPIKSNDYDFLKVIKKTLQFSTTRILKEYLKDNNLDENDEKYKFIIAFIELMLDISKIENIFNPPKLSNKKTMMYFMEYIFSMKCDLEYDVYESISILKKIYEDIEIDIRNLRSIWHTKLNDFEIDDDVYKISKVIIDLCYNYSVEDSILNVSKHYKDEDLDKDIIKRLKYQLKIMGGLNERDFFYADIDEFLDYKDIKFPDWSNAVRVIENTDIYKKNNIVYTGLLYEQNEKREVKIWNIKKFKAFLLNICTVLILIITAVVMDNIFDYIENFLEGMSMNFGIQIIVTLLITAFAERIISKFIEIPESTDNLLKSYTILIDYFNNLRTKKKVGYYYE